MTESEHIISPKTYLLVFAALMVLLVLTVGASMVPLGHWSATVAMAIATAKAVIILMFFMHLKYEVGLVRLFAAAGFLWLFHLTFFTMSDYVTRDKVIPAVDQTVEPSLRPTPDADGRH